MAMRNAALALVFAAMTVFWLASGQACAQSIGQPSNGPAPTVTIPANFNQAPAAASTAPGNAGQQPTTESQPGTIVINGVRYYLTTKTQYEFWLAWMTVGIGIIAMTLVCVLFRKHIVEKTEDFVKLFAFVVVVFSAIFLIAVGYNDSQTAPVYSLLGTIIGYIFGREFTARRQQAESEHQQQPSSAQKPLPATTPTAAGLAGH
jgi:hypothetical protein